MAPHSSTLAWKIPWMDEPGRLQSMGSLRVGHDWATSLSFFPFIHWRRKWQPTPVFLPGESQGRGSLVGCHLWGRTAALQSSWKVQTWQRGKALRQHKLNHFQGAFYLLLKHLLNCVKKNNLDNFFGYKGKRMHQTFRKTCVCVCVRVCIFISICCFLLFFAGLFEIFKLNVH